MVVVEPTSEPPSVTTTFPCCSDGHGQMRELGMRLAVPRRPDPARRPTARSLTRRQ